MKTPAEIDITNAGYFRAALLAAAGRGAGLTVIDLSRTQFCDSADLHALVTAHKRARTAGGEVRLVVSDRHVLRIFTSSGPDRVIACHHDAGQALAPSSPHAASPARCA